MFYNRATVRLRFYCCFVLDYGSILPVLITHSTGNGVISFTTHGGVYLGLHTMCLRVHCAGFLRDFNFKSGKTLESVREGKKWDNFQSNPTVSKNTG